MGAALLLALAIAFAARAEAQRSPSSAGLNWVRLEGAESCISAAELVARVEGRVNRVLFTSTADAELFVDGRVQPVDLNAWLVTLQTSDRTGRVLGSRSLLFRGVECSVIDENVALFIAVRLYPGSGFDDPLPFTIDGGWPIHDDPDPSPVELPVWRPPAGHEPQAKPSEPRDDAAPSPSLEPPRTERARPIVDLSAVGSLGLLPAPGPGAALHLTVFPGFGWPLQLGFTALLERTRGAELIAGQAAFTLQVGSAELCPVRATSWLWLCAGAEVGRLGVSPTGFRESWPANQVVADLLASSVVRVALFGSLSLQLRGVVAAPLVRPPYHYETPGGKRELYRLPSIAGRGELGIGFEL